MIDWTRVEELKSDVGADEFDEVVELFFMEVETAIEALPDATDRDAALHFIKGCALNLGLVDLAALCDTRADDPQIIAVFEGSKTELSAKQAA